MNKRAIAYKARANWEKTDRTISPVAEGLRKIGWIVEERESTLFPQGDERNFDLAVVWGDTLGALSILNAYRHVFPQVLHVDNGYLNRVRWTGHYSLSWGGERQCHQYLWQSPICSERWNVLGESIRQWRTDGQKILLLAPSIKQGKILGFDTDTWARQTVDKIHQYTKRPVLVRIKRYNVDVPLRAILQNESIFAAVGYNTKGLIECLLEGIPIFPLAPCAAMSMGHHNLAQIEIPDYPSTRQVYFERLAGTQFLLSEIADSIPFAESFMAATTEKSYHS